MQESTDVVRQLLDRIENEAAIVELVGGFEKARASFWRRPVPGDTRNSGSDSGLFS